MPRTNLLLACALAAASPPSAPRAAATSHRDEALPEVELRVEHGRDGPCAATLYLD